MFRGEPIALWTLFCGFIYYLFIQIFGLIMTGVIKLNIFYTLQSHFFLVYLGWIGFIILGAQLQFYRAITGLRKYEPEILRKALLVTLNFGLILIIYGTSTQVQLLFQLGIILYLCGVLIHFYWLTNQKQSKYFKFPLDYFYVAQVIFIVGLISILISSFNRGINIVQNITEVKHILAIGWISLTLQGAMIRILPMFLGTVIHRKSRRYLDYHFRFSSIVTVLFAISFYFKNDLIIGISGFLWILSWVWTILIMIWSIVPNLSTIQNKITLGFFSTGFIWLISGMLLGFYLQFFTPKNANILDVIHAHLSLFAGLSLIMLGAYHRIHSFQIYTILYTGKRDQSIKIEKFFNLPIIKIYLIVFNILVPFMIYGFYENNFTFVGIVGSLYLVNNLLYFSIIVKNYYFYLKNKKDAIPFWLKAREKDIN